MKTTLLTSLFAAGMVASSQAALVVYEPFDMAAGDLNGTSSTGSTGLSGSWSTAGTVTSSAGSLGYGALPTSDGKAGALNTSASSDAQVTTDSSLSSAGLLTDGNTLWFSVVINPASTANKHSGFAFGSDGIQGQYNGVDMKGTGDGFGIYFNGNSFKAAEWVGGNQSTGTGTAFTGTGLGSSTLLVGEIIWSAGTDTMNLYMPNISDLSDKGTAQSVTGTYDQSTWNIISFSGRGNDGIDYFDEIRFGATYADVTSVPEPSAALLGGIGCLLLLRRRRSA